MEKQFGQMAAENMVTCDWVKKSTVRRRRVEDQLDG